MNELKENVHWSDRLRQERIRRSWRQKEIADQLGTTVLTVKRWERGRQVPGSYFRQKLCLLFEKSAEELGFVSESLHSASFSPTKKPIIPASPSCSTETGLWGVPFLRNPFFTGRENVLQQLHEALHPAQTALLSQSSALCGLGGIGKTQTAIEYAYRHAHDYTTLFWVHAQTAESLIASYLVIAELLDLPEKHEQEPKRIVTAVQRWFSRHSGWLLIFDNVEDAGLVKEFLPSSYRGSLLLTSRRPALGLTAQALDLEQMTREEGMRLLLHRARFLESTASLDQISAQEQTAAGEIVALMDGLPLALDQAGAYIEATHCRLIDYLHLFLASSLPLLNEREAYAEHPTSVSSTFLMAFERLEHNHPQAAEVLIVCAFLAPEAIPEEVFQQGAPYLGSTLETLGADPLAFQGAIKALLSYSLLRRHPDTRTLAIHRLVQLVLKEHLSDVSGRTWGMRILKMMAHLFPSDEYTQPDYWQLGKRFLPHALACLAFSEQWNEDKTLALSLRNHVAAYLSKCARYAEAEQSFEHSLRVGGQVLGSQHPLLAEALHGLADNSFEQGNYTRAENLFQQAIHLREQVLGADHPLVALSLNRLGVISWHQGKHERAESFYKQAWRIGKQAVGSEHPLVALPLNNLGIFYWQQGKYAEAEPLYQQALHIWEKTMRSDPYQTSYILNNLGLLYEVQGKYELAEPLYQRALHIWEQTFDPDRSLLAGPLSGLAHLYQDQGKYELAEPLYQRALTIRQHHLGPEHPETAEILHALGCLRQAQSMTTEALALYEQALAIREQTLGPHHLKTRETYTAYIQLLQELEHGKE